MKTVFTEKYVQQLVAQNKEYAVWDSEIAGFGVRVTPTGRKVFTLQARLDGKQRKLTLGYYPLLSVKEARTAFLNKRDLILNGPKVRYSKPDTPRFDEFVNGVWTEQKLNQLKPTSQRSTLSYIHSRLIPGFGDRYLDEIDKPVVAKWFDTYSQTYPGGANRALEILISILEFAIVGGHIEDNPAKGIKKNPKKVLNRFLSAEEIKTVSKLLDKAETESRDYKQGADIARLLLLTGCRHREITLLQWPMIKGDTIKLPDTKTGPREVYLNKQAVAILKRQLKIDTPWVFPLIKNPALPRDNITIFWDDIRKRAGIEDVRVHDLRHTFASHAVMKGVTVPMVSKLLGHRKTSMTLRYTHVSDQDTVAAAERIGATLSKLLQGKKTKASLAPEKKDLIPEKLRTKIKPVVLTKDKKMPGKYFAVSLRLNEAELAAASVKAKAVGLSLGKWARVMLDNPPEQLPLPDTRHGDRAGMIGFRVSHSEVETYKQLADQNGYSFSCWARTVLQGKTPDIPEEAKVMSQASTLEFAKVKRPEKTESFSLRVSEAEYGTITARAKTDGMGIGAWLKYQLDNPPEQLPLPDTRRTSRTKCIGFRATGEQMNQYAITAEAAGHSVAWWARLVLLE